MKQKIIFALFVFLVAVAAAKGQGQEVLRVNAGNIRHLHISDDMNIVLMQGSEKEFKFNNVAADNLNMALIGETLHLSVKERMFRKEKITVYIEIGDLKKLTIDGNAVVDTRGVLNAKKIDVYVNGDVKVRLLTMGKVNAYPIGDSEVSVKYTPASVISSIY